jgi:plastocyanin
MPEPSIVKITISEEGGVTVFPDTTIQANDSVFWFNNTSQPHQPAYDTEDGQEILWGPPPKPLPPQQTSSQVLFQDTGTFSYHCTLHSGETGKVTVS